MTQCQGFARYRLVQLREGADLHACMDSLRHHGAHCAIPIPLIGGFRCLCDDEEARNLFGQPEVSAVEEDITIQIVSHQPPSTQLIPAGVAAIRAPQAWDRSQGEGVGVAVIDTGIDLTHPDLAGNIAGGDNKITPGALPQDDHNHGTHVAGIVAGVNNHYGVIGVAPQASLYAVKVMGDDGSGSLSDVLLGLQWVVEKKIPIANLSLGTAAEDIGALRTAIRNAVAAGVLIVAAAGNRGRRGIDYPAAYPGVLAVTALAHDGSLASFSNTGPGVDLAAPGVSVYSTIPGARWTRTSGTSMASPHVAGVAALYLTLHPGEPPSRVREALMATAVPLPGLNAEQQGAGRVDALNAVSYAPPSVKEEEPVGSSATE